ncbi:hypothetical protein GCM10022407_16130 [Hymenobacter antarcticus]|uniref:Uncharacterized protein n=1 Tax=Hymenobacter antarcticus TaxID=486270 RepID=A0ABP7PU87_9BACT
MAVSVGTGEGIAIGWVWVDGQVRKRPEKGHGKTARYYPPGSARPRSDSWQFLHAATAAAALATALQASTLAQQARPFVNHSIPSVLPLAVSGLVLFLTAVNQLSWALRHVAG